MSIIRGEIKTAGKFYLKNFNENNFKSKFLLFTTTERYTLSHQLSKTSILDFDLDNFRRLERFCKSCCSIYNWLRTKNITNFSLAKSAKPSEVK